MLKTLYFVPAKLNQTCWAIFYQKHILIVNMKLFPQEMSCFSFLIDFDCVTKYPQLLHDHVNAEKERVC